MSGKDMTFSGRTTIWAIMKDEIFKHPLLGIGYASFWLGPDFPSPAFIFKIRMYIYPGEAHNGYLEVMNELGSVGIFALIGYLFEYIKQSVRLLQFDRRKAALYIAMLFSQLIANMSEAYWWNIASVQFFVITLVTFDMACTLRQKSMSDKLRAAEAAKAQINAIANPVQLSVGDKFNGSVVKLATFGAFVNLAPGKDGLLHISQIRKMHGGKRIENLEEVMKVGEKIEVVINEIDPKGKYSLVPANLPEEAKSE
ncbi:MAG: S1 RNA-binding domain-containing protein [Actinobacteria bacterium]|nr:S1 RNA-binding domain-containing protein [Actinomycetota bacterium]